VAWADSNRKPFSLRLFAYIRAISVPFNANSFVEVKLELCEDTSPYKGEIYIRVPAGEVEMYKIGDLFSFKMTQVE